MAAIFGEKYAKMVETQYQTAEIERLNVSKRNKTEENQKTLNEDKLNCINQEAD